MRDPDGDEHALTPIAERSHFVRTGRYDEVERLCTEYASRWPQFVRSLRYGITPEGRPLVALLVTRAGALESGELARRGVPVLMFQACIHPGESDGKDAGFIVLRELLANNLRVTQLERIAVLFVPVVSPDGHERMARWNRINQVGPEETGWRANALNLNLNRDYTKADAPEMQGLLRLMNEWDPILCADLHVSDGAQFEHDVSTQVEPCQHGAPELQDTGRAIRTHVMDELSRQGSLPLHFYYSLAQRDDPSKGFADWLYTPRFSTGYWPLRNRFTLLVETHSWKDYGTRVRVTINILRALIDLAAEQGRNWRAQAGAADARASRLGGSSVPIAYELSDSIRMIDFRGCAYTRTPSDVSGALMTTYYPEKPEIWHVPLRDQFRVSREVIAPGEGYAIPAAWAREIGPRLAMHGIQTALLDPRRGARMRTFRASTFKFDGVPFEGRTRLSVEGDWRVEHIDLPAGTLFVPIAQPLSRLVLTLLEPQAEDSFLAWGFFNACFERKEYMEAYVAEQAAREMLAADPVLAAEFKRLLAEDPAFAGDPAARLDFFYQRHASWDQRFALYPIVRIEAWTEAR